MMEYDLMHIISAAVLLALAVSVVYLIISHQRNLWKEQNKLHEYKLSQQQKITQAIIQAQENERERIAKDLHDEIGALAVSLKMNNESIKENLNNPHTLDLIREKNEHLANEIIRTGRQVSHDLLPPGIRYGGLVNALKNLSEDLSNEHNTLINFKCESFELKVNEIVEISIYRVLKEWIHNVISHAEATELNITMELNNGILKIISSDNGKGFDYKRERINSTGLGLMNIEGRLNNLNAKYDFISNNGSGTQLSIEYAINQN